MPRPHCDDNFDVGRGQGWAAGCEEEGGGEGGQLNLNLRRILTPGAAADLAPSFARSSPSSLFSRLHRSMISIIF